MAAAAEESLASDHICRNVVVVVVVAFGNRPRPLAVPLHLCRRGDVTPVKTLSCLHPASSPDQVRPVLAQPRHRDLRHDPGDPAGHHRTGHLLRAHLLVTQGKDRGGSHRRCSEEHTHTDVLATRISKDFCLLWVF